MVNSAIDNNFYFTKSVLFKPLLFLGIMWFLFLFDNIFNANLFVYGILPRTQVGLKGILFSPFLHGSWEHLLNNSLPIFILISLLKYFYRKQFWSVFLLGFFMTGIGTWFIGSNNYHIGASGIIYCLASFIFFKGIMSKYFRLVALSFFIVIIYGGMVWYMFPNAETITQSISWEAHFMGFLSGLILGIFIKTPQFEKPLLFNWQHPDFDPNQDTFMRQFDEHGNFMNPTPPEPEEQGFFTSSIQVIYEFLGKKN